MHTGVKGFVRDVHGKPLEGASISVSDRQHPVTTATDGDYWRLLVPGSYEIQATKTGYKPQRKVVEVHYNQASVLDFNLKSVRDDGDQDEPYTGVRTNFSVFFSKLSRPRQQILFQMVSGLHVM